MPPPRTTIPDSDADSTPSSPSTSPAPPTIPIPATAPLASRKRSASPNQSEPAAEPTVAEAEAVDATESTVTGSLKSSEESTSAPAPEEQSQEAKEEERKEKQIEAIKARNQELAEQVKAMEAQLVEARGKLKNPDAAATVKAHIKRLHAYNEIRDIGQGLIGLIAEQRGVRIKECYESGEFGVGAKD
ncbi:hypothetical protein V495_02585 [Pseudogymnoascus sp. VKM F-4514 (FW-929)]|nr:hypothetical protein V495_02585 [Pseudogymnoascus sp. VKM F-4514 (FW-929)]KFY52523.1 hypothetical protein V497_08502 [Pseudogymnoascus sp. VKM F-4516 (FW-969)]